MKRILWLLSLVALSLVRVNINTAGAKAIASTLSLAIVAMGMPLPISATWRYSQDCADVTSSDVFADDGASENQGGTGALVNPIATF